jgi:hypothetical protein
MRFDDVPDRAYDIAPTPVPMKVVPDWDALYETLLREPYIVLDVPVEDLRYYKSTAAEAPTVKGLNNHVRLSKKRKLLTKRISATRWLCMLG